MWSKHITFWKRVFCVTVLYIYKYIWQSKYGQAKSFKWESRSSQGGQWNKTWIKSPFSHVTAGLWPHRYHRLQTRGLHSPLGLTLGCETLGLGFVPTNKPKKKSHLSLRYFEHDIQDIICYRSSFTDGENMHKLQGVNIMMMWEEAAAAFTTDTTI